jgi:hypothetical protein
MFSSLLKQNKTPKPKNPKPIEWLALQFPMISPPTQQKWYIIRESLPELWLLVHFWGQLGDTVLCLPWCSNIRHDKRLLPNVFFFFLAFLWCSLRVQQAELVPGVVAEVATTVQLHRNHKWRKVRRRKDCGNSRPHQLREFWKPAKA